MSRPIELLPGKEGWARRQQVLSDLVRAHFKDAPGALNVLEAGCGHAWALDLAGMDYRLTGVDISREALAIRAERRGDLDRAIEGDLRTVDLGAEEYDVAYSSYVLEHIENAESVLDRLFLWLKPRGLLILMIPDRSTTKGFLTRIAPFRLHVWYKSIVEKNKNAGKPGHAPFPTPFETVVSRRGIQDYCARNRHAILLEMGQPFYHPSRALSLFASALSRALEVLSFGRLTGAYSDLVYVIQK
jgi:SAM-dependent methyltransferase